MSRRMKLFGEIVICLLALGCLIYGAISLAAEDPSEATRHRNAIFSGVGDVVDAAYVPVDPAQIGLDQNYRVTMTIADGQKRNKRADLRFACKLKRVQRKGLRRGANQLEDLQAP